MKGFPMESGVEIENDPGLYVTRNVNDRTGLYNG